MDSESYEQHTSKQGASPNIEDKCNIWYIIIYDGARWNQDQYETVGKHPVLGVSWSVSPPRGVLAEQHPRYWRFYRLSLTGPHGRGIYVANHFYFFLDFNLMIFDVYCRSLRCTIKTKRIELQSVSMVEPKQRSPYWVKGAAGLRVCITISNHGKFYSQKMSTIIGKIWIIYVAIHEDNT